MSENEQLAAGPSPATLEAIIAAANARAILLPETMEAVRRWLSQVLARAIRRANAIPLTKPDVDRLEAAYRRFCAVIEELADRDDPPPRVPVADGSTDWEHWLIGHQHFGFKGGRRESSDWRLIASLLALYETLSHNPASGAQAGGPTMRFLKTSLSQLASYAPPTLRCNFASPNAEALRKQLDSLREFAIPIETKRLDKIINPAGE